MQRTELVKGFMKLQLTLSSHMALDRFQDPLPYIMLYHSPGLSSSDQAMAEKGWPADEY